VEDILREEVEVGIRNLSRRKAMRRGQHFSRNYVYKPEKNYQQR